MYRFVDAVTLRAPALTEDLGFWPDLTDPCTGPAELQKWLGQAWALPGFADAVAAASPVLAGRVQQLLHGPVPTRELRRAVVSVIRYLLRATTRCTPFGLLAGTAPVRLSQDAAWHLGQRHRPVVRAGAAWLEAQITGLETEAALRCRLTVVATNLAVERDGRITLAWHRAADGGEPQSVSVRHTPAVKAVMSATARPMSVQALAEQLTAARGPGASPAAAHHLLATLISHGLLITSLRPPATAGDPLGHLLAALADAGAADLPETAATVAELNAISKAAKDYTASEPRGSLDELAETMAALTPRERGHPLGVDLRLDWQADLPEQVASEAAAAAALLVRLARRPVLSKAWQQWHRRFLERYGPGAAVPVTDAVDAERGIGFPAGYRDQSPTALPTLSDRDTALLALAQNAAADHRTEVLLTDALLAHLSAPDGATPVQPHAEITFHMHADDAEALRDGRFQISVLSVSRAAGTMTGRLLDVLDPDRKAGIAAAYTDLPTVNAGAIRAQLSAPGSYVRTGNVTRSAQVLNHVLALGGHHGNGDRIDLADLAVVADADRLYLVSLSRGAVVEPVVFNAVELVRHAHPLQRFLHELPVALCVPCDEFSWGPAAEALPFLPALRYGRIVLSPARWLLEADTLPGPAAPWPQWTAALRSWRHSRDVPATVELGTGDVRLRLDLNEPAHLAILRADLNRGRRVRLTQPPATGRGWLDGRPHEIVVPVAATAAAAPPRTWTAAPATAGHIPGRGRWVYAKLYASLEHQTAVLTGHLRRLLSADGTGPECWFLRYQDPEPHLRVRLAAAEGYASATARLTAWAEDLRARGLAGRVQLDTYYPETGRFGSGPALAAAEDFFCADSAAAIAELRAGADGTDLDALAAASFVDLAVAAHGSTATGLRWIAEHTLTTRPAPDRRVYNQAVTLSNPADQHALAALPGGPDIIEAWQRRRQSLTAWAAHHEVVSLLPDLFHLHQARLSGVGDATERSRLHLARAAALSWIARTGSHR